ncbi:Ferredoxin-NADP reductase [Faunimonas pinastri]|uniref:Ferredoxin-NADP reductase n=1 Tax=Faunimonas pinastri TaxID=1855383 RepID=A0A1H9FQL2_9HYPH|nr:Ferredoxin-NADP reductase [Faunimonas pinastri]
MSERLRWREASIERIVPRTPDIVSVLLRADLPRSVAGQHVDVRLTAPDGYQAQRSYSISSAPGSASTELIIERLEGGEVSPFFHEIAQADDVIEVRGPIGGYFVWRKDDGGPLLLVAGGSGIAPLMAIVRDLAVAAPDTPALLIHSARRSEDLVFRDELLDLQARLPAFGFVAVTTRETPEREGDYGRRIDRTMLAEVLGKWGVPPSLVYVCGSNPFVENVASGLVDEGVPPQVIRTERYGA